MSFNRLLSDCVMTIPNAVPDDIIDRLLNLYESSERWKPARVAMGMLNRRERCCDVIDLVSSSESEFNQGDAWAGEVLNTAVQQAYVRYRQAFPKAVVSQDSGY